VEAYGGPFTFSNSMSPLQVAVVRESLRIVRSDEGERRRQALMSSVRELRGALGDRGFRCLGEPSAIVPVLIGHTPLARLASRAALERSLFVNLVEFPAVGIRAARFRMQVQADHTLEQVRAGAALLAAAVEEGRDRLAETTEARRQPVVATSSAHPASPWHGDFGVATIPGPLSRSAFAP
jgi:glycine C-acetyltransferase